MNYARFSKALKRLIMDPNYRFLIRANAGLYNSVEDEAFLCRKFRSVMGYELNLDHPCTFNEKLQWIKIHDRNPLYTQLADKFSVRQYVADKIGEEHLIPLLGIWETPEEIDFDALPSRFVLKCNHNSGLGMKICQDKRLLTKKDILRIRRNLRRGMDQDYYLITREWPYRDIPRKIIAEQYIADDNGHLTDYKVHCFNGEPKLILVCRDRFSTHGMTEDFYTADWEHLKLCRPGQKNADKPINKPSCLDEMLSLAKELSDGIPFVRADFYIVNEIVFFGELTFFPMSGLGKFEPPDWDKKLGDLLQLPKI